MDHSLGLAVSVVEALEDLGGDVAGVARRQHLAVAAQGGGEPLQGGPVDVLHGDEVDVLHHPELVDGDDVAVAQRDQGLGLGHEQINELALARELGMDLLDDQPLLEAARPDQLGQVNLGHPTGRQLGGKEVLAETGGDRRHRPRSVPLEPMVPLRAPNTLPRTTTPALGTTGFVIRLAGTGPRLRCLPRQ
jgi:hypothetical protein